MTHPQSPDSEREEFEAWAANAGYAAWTLETDDRGGYMSGTLHGLWRAWQAARASRPASPAVPSFDEWWDTHGAMMKESLHGSHDIAFAAWEASPPPEGPAVAALREIAAMTFDPWTNGAKAGEIARAALAGIPQGGEGEP